MNGQMIFKRGILSAVFAACAGVTSVVQADASATRNPLAGTWTLVAADVQHPDGTRTSDYGAAPKGLLVIDNEGRYSLQIFKSERPKFASGDKGVATPVEYKAAVMGASTHFGTLSIDPAAGTLTFHIQNASFPNWEGEQQTRSYALNGRELSYRVTPRPNGDVPISVWQRLDLPMQSPSTPQARSRPGQ
ncbi:lipocalin-like domain-containing protein [Pandoraea sp. PE-S2R-1]|uniref:lipocalin-like domain-containing protein n=1 Tax=Pandoraea sp. PE-S2R-1 TaxID=1986994 RepID=UPI000B3FDEC4|nr:lipocalin-like domain-containing protein [Pandoraea sp. PE-S2R-1]